ncbi:MAG TPA: hypothetical protein DIS96_02960, partial [Pusillimonas sp.]|nr:hypothetical protein [Pusillimonas sp.]
MDNPLALIETLQNLIKNWASLSRRAQLEAAMPTLEILSKHRVEYAKLAKLLTEMGLEIKPDTLRQAMHRWRKKQQITQTPDNQKEPLQTGTSLPEPGHPNGDKKNQSTKARLREIRNEPIDLDQITRQARKLNSRNE